MIGIYRLESDLLKVFFSYLFKEIVATIFQNPNIKDFYKEGRINMAVYYITELPKSFGGSRTTQLIKTKFKKGFSSSA